jgi:hypothetical protein
MEVVVVTMMDLTKASIMALMVLTFQHYMAFSVS